MPGNKRFLRLHKGAFQKTAPHSNDKDMLQSKLPYSTHQAKMQCNKPRDDAQTDSRHNALASRI